MKNKKIIILFFIICLNFSMLIVSINETSINNQENTNSGTLKTSQVEQGGKIYTTKMTEIHNCYINNKQPGLNRLPKIHIPNYILSSAELDFDDIIVHNFTYDLEPEYTAAFKTRSYSEPTYIYQKFWVERSQYINNVSIYVLDEINENDYNEQNSWEIAILNCSNDFYGTPNETIQSPLVKPHPRNAIPHWEHFDFLNSEIGSIFLDKDNTNFTIENGFIKYWFALRIKMPPNDYWQGGGEKYLFFNPDGDDPNDIGEGETFAQGQFGYGSHRKLFFQNNVSACDIINGTLERGRIPSFAFMDNDRFIAQSNTNNLTLNATIDFTSGNDWWLWLLKEELPNKTPEELEKIFGIAWAWEKFWNLIHPYLLYGFDFNIATNISGVGNILTANMFIQNSSSSEWVNVTQYINVRQGDESLITVSIRDREGKDDILSYMGNISKDYFLNVKFNYTSNGAVFNVSFNELTMDLVRLDEISALQIFDPGIEDLFYPINATVDPSTGSTIENPDLNVLELNDGNYFIANSINDNLTIEFDFNLVPYLNSSLWTMDQSDYQYVFPNPTIPEMTLRLSSKVSIQGNSSVQNNLTTAVLEVYVGAASEYLYVPERLEWLPVWGKELLAHEDEFQIPARINTTDSWFIFQMVNSSDQKNSLKFRLRYEWNGAQTPPPGGFNVTIDEFSFDITVQNAKSSDIASLVGFGYNNSALKPPDISMEVQGSGVSNDSTWSGAIANGIPSLDGYFEFNITSRWEAVSFNVTITYTIYKYIVELDFEKSIKSQYMTGTNYFSVEVTDDSGNELEDIKLTFELLDSDDKVVDEDTAVTNDEGVAKGSLKFDEVGDGYRVKVSFDEDSIYAEEDIKSDEFRIVDEYTLFIDNVLFFLPYILIAIAGITIFVTVRHHRMSKLRRFWAGEALILDDLLKISYLLIINKDAGVTIFNKQISMELDSDLIGGFLTAISQFRSELKKDAIPKSADKGIEMDYYDFKIVITDGTYVRVALILDEIPSERLKENQWEFTRRFEMKHQAILKDFTGDIRPYKETDELVDRIFNIRLMYPLQLAKHWEFTKLSKLEKALVEVGLEMQKERNFIFASSLLSYGLAGRKASRDQIISTILDLKRRGILIPMEIE